MTKQAETTIKLRYWGEDADHSPEVHDSWVRDELPRVAGMVGEGLVEGVAAGPEGERGYWEIETKCTDSAARASDPFADAPGFDLDQIQWLQEGTVSDDPAAALRAVIKVGPAVMHLHAVAVSEGEDGIWETVDPAYEDALESIESANGDDKSGTTMIDGREYVLWALPSGR